MNTKIKNILIGLGIAAVVLSPFRIQFEVKNINDEVPKSHVEQVTNDANLIVSNYSEEAIYQTENKQRISSAKSKIVPTDQVLRAENEKAFLTVKLFDDNGSPVVGHELKLVSSAEHDGIRVPSGSTISDRNGEVSFEVYPSYSGTATYSAYDVTDDVILNERAKIVVFESNNEIFGSVEEISLASADNGSGNYGNSSGPVDYLKFENVPNTVYAGESISPKITAYDAADQVVINYSGTVRFSAQGENSNYALLPNDYTFTAQDQGSHTFSLGFMFQQPGEYDIQVTDLGNLQVTGEQTFVVSQSLSDGDDPEGEIVILNPTPGTYSSNVQVISGNAPANAKLKIFDNDIQIGSIIAGTDGKFSFTTGVLLDGEHKIYVASVNDVGTIIATSPVIDLVVDTNAPTISQVLIEPGNEVDAGSQITVKLYVEDELSEARLELNGNVSELTKTEAGYYMVAVAAPIEFGEYSLDFVIVDELGNESTFNDQATLTVGPAAPTDDDEEAHPDDVKGLVVTPGDTRVTLNWTEPDSANPIKNYRVYYGTSPNQLTEAVDTFTDATTWYIPNLQNEVEYYFAVIAVDEMGKTSEGFNKIVASTPLPAVVEVLPPDVANGSGGAEALDDMDKDVSESGPEMIWLVLVSAIGGIFYSQIARRRLRLREKFFKE